MDRIHLPLLLLQLTVCQVHLHPAEPLLPLYALAAMLPADGETMRSRSMAAKHGRLGLILAPRVQAVAKSL
jgi:hypothetical protein